MSKSEHAKSKRVLGNGDALRTLKKLLSISRIAKKKNIPLLLSLLSCLVLIPATAGATGQNIGERGAEECKHEWWGISRPDLNPNGNYAYYVQEEPYNHDNPKIEDVMGWHNTNTTDSGNTAANSHMVIIGGNVNLRNVYGGYSSSGDACNNIAIVNSGTISGNVVGGYTHESKTATGNKVFIYGGNFTGADKAVSGGQGKDANENKVTIYGGTFAGEISGGVIMKNDGNAKNNTVVIAGNFSGTPSIYGGNVGDSGYTIDDIVTGNTLYLSGANSASTVQNFETINITEAAWGTPVLTMNGPGLVQNSKRNGETNGSWATINTGNINFTGAKNLSAGEKTTLIKNKMDSYHGDILFGKYTAGTALRGTGTAEIEGEDLMYTVQTVEISEQTHNTVMGAEVSMAALSTGNDFIGTATEGLSLAANTGADGIASFAQMGGSSIKQETGSHVDVHTWNAILGIGHQNKKERGTFEYGAFFEYGTGNYTTHAENGLRGDGSSHYTGGGLLAKYTRKNNVYVEGSLRAGSIHDDARDVMSDGAGNPYSYDTNAPYFGFHVGVGKEIALADGNSVDVYGKYFFNHKNGVSFNAGGYYDLDAVNSHVLRVGARYTVKRKKWNFYGGLSYEHELDGKASGAVDGVSIRAAETKGGSVRAELGATMTPDDGSPWKLDLNLAGFAGKKQGFTGGVSIAFMF